jgi:uncharacterized protein YbjQ (UPF0145 family)
MAESAAPLAATSWSSSLSVPEMAALHQAGLVARGLVMGSSVYQIGISYSPVAYATAYGGGPWGGGTAWGGGGGPWGGGGGQWGGGGPGRRPTGGYGRNALAGFPGWYRFYSGWGGGGAGAWAGAGGLGGAGAVCWERTTFEQGLEAAAALALERVEAETVALGAHGVIGTKLEFRWLEGLASTVEFTAIGTAVTRPGAAPLARPFTSHLDAQALLKLLRAGLVPTTLAVGAGSVTAELPSLGVTGTTEIVPFGEAAEASRRIAGERLARNVGGPAWAVIGTQAGFRMEGEGAGRTMTTVLTGTAVTRFASGPADRLPLPIMRLSRP